MPIRLFLNSQKFDEETVRVLYQSSQLVTDDRPFAMGDGHDFPGLIDQGVPGLIDQGVPGVAAVIAESFARIFYRNSFAIGLPALEVPGITKQVNQFDEISINLQDWSVTTKDGTEYHALKVPEFLRGLMREGGLVEYYKRHKSFPWEQMQATPGTT